MKKILLLVILLFTVATFSQDALHLKDGSIIKGRVYKVIGGKVWFIPSDKIKNIRNTSPGRFKKDSWKNSKKYTKSKIKKLIKNYSEVYEYRDINKLKSILSREIVTTGKVKLYAAFFDYGISYSGAGGITLRSTSINVCYYVKRNNESLATKLPPNLAGKTWNGRAAIYFSKCSEIARKIKKRIYRHSDIPLIVRMYNNDCN